MTRLGNTAAAATATVAAAAFLLLGPARAAGPPDSSPPTGAVAGARDPASGTLQLLLSASDAGSGLAVAEASLGDRTTVVRLGTGSCPQHPSPGGPAPQPGDCPASVGGVALALDTRPLPDGSHHLTVRVTDAAGNAATLLDEMIAVRNAPTITGGSASVTIGVANRASGSSTGGDGDGRGRRSPPPRGGAAPCRWPKLRMRLVAKPLWRTRPGRLPVLRFRRLHLYRGWLTCRAGNRRILAAPGTPVQVFYRIWRRSFRKRRGPIRVKKGTIRVRPNGRLWVRLGFLSGRTIVFRYLSPGGGVARAKLWVAVARTDPPRRGQ